MSEHGEGMHRSGRGKCFVVHRRSFCKYRVRGREKEQKKGWGAVDKWMLLIGYSDVAIN